jgi:hypothetical protein
LERIYEKQIRLKRLKEWLSNVISMKIKRLFETNYRRKDLPSSQRWHPAFFSKTYT